MEYRAPLRDMHFVLHEVMAAETLWQSMPGTAEFSASVVDAVLEEGARLTSELIAPLNPTGDREGVRLHQGGVATPEGYREAYRTLAEGGWVGLGGNPEYGGQGLPVMVTTLFEEMLQSASGAFALYVILTSGAALCLDTHGSEAMRAHCLPRLYSGDWTAAMCLTEAHAGSDLGLLRTRAEPLEGGRYRLAGTKIFITGGEHDLTENILYLVLARLPDAPEGSRGISLFLVSKFLLDEEGRPGERNAVHCGALEEKMGIHGSSTCVMHFDDAVGELIGEPHRGLEAMFTMMNDERLSVGLQGLGAAERAWQLSLAYARERRQGRAPGDPGRSRAEADPILVHADVRRMLLTQKAWVEGGRAFAAHCGRQLDLARHHPDASQRQRAGAMVALLTPLAKAFMTDRGMEGCLLAQQVFGGHGYIREWGVEQLVRDVRISQIYEGTNGIQAMDLLGRRVVADGGEVLGWLLEDIRDFLAGEGAALEAELRDPVRAAVDQLESLTRWLVAEATEDAHLVSAAAVDYLEALGRLLYGYLWARMAAVARRQLAAGGGEEGFYQAKLDTARFYMERLLPKVASLCQVMRQGSAATMAIAAEHLGP